jgi:hypothetical protein
MIDRRGLLAGSASVLTAGPVAAQSRAGKTIAVSIIGDVTPLSVDRLFTGLRQNIGKSIYLNIFGEKPATRGGPFDFEVDPGKELVIRSSRVALRVLQGEYSIVPAARMRFVLGAHYDCYVDRTDGDPNLIRIERIGLNVPVERGLSAPTIKL